MDYLDEEDTRPRIVFRSTSSRPVSSNPINLDDDQLKKPHAILFISIAVLLLVFSIFYLETEPSKSLLLWVSLSIFIGLFAPSRITGGNIRVGQGSILQPLEEDGKEEETSEVSVEKRGARRRLRSGKANQIENTLEPFTPVEETENLLPITPDVIGSDGRQLVDDVHETEWSEDDFSILKKQMIKNPPGKPGRWEAIAQAFNGRHKIESIIKKAKELAEVKSGNDDYERFLKNRKAVDSRVQAENENVDSAEWSSAEDVALLNALKAFPKDTTMRWEKIAAAIPGQSKAACMKRFSELKKNFRDSKSNN